MSISTENALRTGEQLIRDERFDDAYHVFESLLDEHPDHVEALNNLAIAAFQTDQYERSVEALLKALRLDPGNEVVMDNLRALFEEPALARYGTGRLQELLTSDDVTQADRNYALMLGHLLSYTDTYHAAACSFEITPDTTSRNAELQGYVGEARATRAVLSPLQVHVLLLEDPNYTKALLVSADIFGFSPSMVRRVREAAAAWGIPPEGILLNASHTHYAPGTMDGLPSVLGTYYEQYSLQIAEAVVNQLPALFRDLSPCLVYRGIADAQIGHNRRVDDRSGQWTSVAPEKEYHTATPFLVLDFLESGSSLLLVNHGCHPTGLRDEAVLSADFPGYLRQYLTEANVADEVLFLQGAAGSALQTRDTDDAPGRTETPEDVAQNGRRLGEAVVTALDETLRPVRGDLFARRVEVDLAYQTRPSMDDVRAMAEKYASRLDADGETASPATRLGYEWAQQMIERKVEELPDHLDLEVQLLALGEETCFLSLPGEPTAGLARSLLEASSLDASTFILGYTNGLQAYLPSADEIEEGGYESEGSRFVYGLPAPFDSSLEETLAEAVGGHVSAWRSADRANGYGRYHLPEAQGPAFFALSTGRCGTKTLAHILDTASDARVYHHPRPYLIEETLAAYHGEVDRAETFWRARSGVIRDAWKDGLTFGELDHNMTAFAPAIADEIDDVRFLVLIRNPWDFVRSGMRRGYYQGHGWDAGRLRPEPDHPDYERWDRMAPFEKVCWLWNDTYRRILAFVSSLPEDRYLVVPFEELVDSTETSARIFDFLDLDGYDDGRVQAILRKQLNKQPGGDFPAPDRWSPAHHEQLWSTCAESIEAFGLTAYKERYRHLTGDGTATASRPDPPDASGTSDGGTPRVETTTIWDYKKFVHQPYPATITPALFTDGREVLDLIDVNTPIASMGSCFARNVAKYLMQRDFNYLVTEEPFEQASAHWDQVFNTACMRQIFEYSLTDDWHPATRWWPKGEHVQDPYRRDILYPSDACKEHFERHRAASREALTQAEVIILTLGLIETWRDKRDGMTYYRVPSPSVYDPDIHEFYVQTVPDCLEDLNRIYALLATHNPDARLVVTVSPVPLFATFRMDVDVASANMLSKSTLRVAAEYFAHQHDRVHYFPSYEIVLQAVPDPYEDDNRHVTPETVQTVMEVFETLYVRTGAPG